MMRLSAVLEGILFIVGEEGISLEEVMKILEIDYDKLKEIIKILCEEYNTINRGIELKVLGNRLKLTTKKEYKNYFEKLVPDSETILSQAALETLAIIAYNQPITRSEIDEIRGISSSHMVRKLTSRSLIKEVGRSEKPGRPVLYGITNEFLDYFGLASIEELPKMELEELENPEKDLYGAKYKEELES